MRSVSICVFSFDYFSCLELFRHFVWISVYQMNNWISSTAWGSSTRFRSSSFCLVVLKVDAVDPKSRHKGKLETESLLASRDVNWTSLRPVYIYGPLNYNPVEEWFFHRLKAGRPIPIPNSGIQITQLGHVKVCSSNLCCWVSTSILMNSNTLCRTLQHPSLLCLVIPKQARKYLTFLERNMLPLMA